MNKIVVFIFSFYLFLTVNGMNSINRGVYEKTCKHERAKFIMNNHVNNVENILADSSKRFKLGTENNFSTPWYGVIGLRANTAKYKQVSTTAKGSMAYFEISSVTFSRKSYMDFGIPFGGYVMKLLVTGKLSGDNATGEVPFIYIKGGFDVFKAGFVKIGLGASGNSVFMRLPNEMLGYSSLKYGALSPLLYAKINVGPFLIAPVFEYHVIKWTDNREIDRSGFVFNTYVFIPIGTNFALNINPYFEKGKFKVSSTQYENMSTTNVGVKVGIVLNLN